ncbi:DUF2187 family protein [Oceanobacillus salinisoli]|uniref:DUF2187 family protein n=1 Tax=Oceanobacillus salinisoli TaxID=2678611 RepID=UPI0012E31A9A|nr:DUF2187 family protein [Oceanobacillus salinisoli]
MEKSNHNSIKKNKASIGDKVIFDRKNNQYEGKVFQVRDASVLVEISKESAKTLGYELPNTVVRHGNYMIMLHN